MSKPQKPSLREAAEMAVDVLTNLGYDPVDLREALAEQAEQEPVAWVCEGKLYEVQQYNRRTELPYPNQIPLYAAPVQQVDLTDDELNALWYGNTKGGWLGLFRAVIAKFKEKNRG